MNSIQYRLHTQLAGSNKPLACGVVSADMMTSEWFIEGNRPTTEVLKV
jgi:hypothetical protein